MKKVVLFKSVSEDYKQAFSKKGFETVFVQPLEFLYVNLEELNRELQKKEYNGIILTSPRAIEALSKRWDPSKFVLWNTKRIYTVGDTSGSKIKLLLGLEASGMTSGNAENLAEIISKENEANSSFLFPCGNLSTETLPSILQAKGIIIRSLTVYETTENRNLKTDLMHLESSGDSPCGMVFFSPSGCEYIHRQLQTFSNKLSHLPHFAIGNSTAHKIENLGLEIAGVAAKPKAECIIESLKNYFSLCES